MTLFYLPRYVHVFFRYGGGLFIGLWVQYINFVTESVDQSVINRDYKST
jgi:hypothetical protein